MDHTEIGLKGNMLQQDPDFADAALASKSLRDLQRICSELGLTWRPEETKDSLASKIGHRRDLGLDPNSQRHLQDPSNTSRQPKSWRYTITMAVCICVMWFAAALSILGLLYVVYTQLQLRAMQRVDANGLLWYKEKETYNMVSTMILGAVLCIGWLFLARWIQQQFTVSLPIAKLAEQQSHQHQAMERTTRPPRNSVSKHQHLAASEATQLVDSHQVAKTTDTSKTVLPAVSRPVSSETALAGSLSGSPRSESVGSQRKALSSSQTPKNQTEEAGLILKLERQLAERTARLQHERSATAGLESEIEEVERRLGDFRSQNERLRQEIADDHEAREQATIMALEKGSTVQLFARVRLAPEDPRPRLALEPEDKTCSPNSLTIRAHSVYSRKSNSLNGPDLPTKDQRYDFDHVFIDGEDNTDIYGHIRPMTMAFLRGTNGTLILDGPSGSGKSHTFFGTKNSNDGLAFQIGREIFDFDQRHEQHTLADAGLVIYAFEVYNGRVLDLKVHQKSRHEDRNLVHVPNPGSQHLATQQSPSTSPLKFCRKEGATYHDITGWHVGSVAEMHKTLRYIRDARHVSHTGQNSVSSRGHLVCLLELTINSRISTLSLVDLAGPEPGHSSLHASETNAISGSRLQLKEAIFAMLDLRNTGQVPAKVKAEKTLTHRASVTRTQFTRLLKSGLNPDARLFIITTAFPNAEQQYWNRIMEAFDFAKEIRSYSNNGRPKVAEPGEKHVRTMTAKTNMETAHESVGDGA